MREKRSRQEWFGLNEEVEEVEEEEEVEILELGQERTECSGLSS